MVKRSFYAFWAPARPTPGLVMSACVLLAAASAIQLGYLVALVEDRC